MDTNDFFKYRSITACMKASYDTLSSSITSLLKKTWWAVLIYSLFMALTTYFRIPNKALHDWGETAPMASFILQSVIYLGTFIADLVCGAAIWGWINKRTLVNNLSRYCPAFIVFNVLLLAFLLGGGYIAQSIHTTWAIPLCLLIVLLMMVVTLPFAHLIPDLLLQEKAKDFHVWKSYKSGLQHLGSIFLTGFLSGIILMLISLLLMTPTMILTWAQLSAQLGALDGDPLGVPGYFTPLLLFVLVITFFILIYLSTWMYMTYAYLYGSHKTLEEEKKKRMMAATQMAE